MQHPLPESGRRAGGNRLCLGGAFYWTRIGGRAKTAEGAFHGRGPRGAMAAVITGCGA